MKEKICKFCGEHFIPRSNRQIYCDREHWRKCPSCGKMYLEKFPENLSKSPRLCSPRCGSAKKRKLPRFSEICRIGDSVIVDSTVLRKKYDNLTISKWYQSQRLQCIHWFPGEDISKLERWCDKSKEYSAEDFEVYKLNLDYTKEFLEENDIVTFRKSNIIAIGLVKNAEIFQVLTFSVPRYNKNYDYELVRCCTKLGCKIHGGLDLLSSKASLVLGVNSCICYVDLAKQFDCSEYQSIGLRLNRFNVPRLLSSSVFNCGTNVYVFK